MLDASVNHTIVVKLYYSYGHIGEFPHTILIFPTNKFYCVIRCVQPYYSAIVRNICK